MRNSNTGKEVRQSFIEFFKTKSHTFVPSSPLVPGEDQTLLFTNAGMVQFKEIFLGADRRSYTRAVNSQKCMRVAGKHNDLDDVGRDDTHHTFFEMLGNWSFGDYYKKEAIGWAWELLTDVWKLDRSRLWVTCFKDEHGQIPTDHEAEQIWRTQPGIDPNHILFYGRKDNLWEMADTGPCGPCSEIHYDLGENRCNCSKDRNHVCDVNGDCGRFLEIWNLVFIQYNRINANDFVPLPQMHVDTGMGFERIVSILQGVTSNYRTDLFLPILGAIQQITGHSNNQREAMMTPYRVIADHVRAATFLIADGVIPGNIGRNYVCRMIIRRAALFGSKIGLTQPFLHDISKVVVEEYGEAYPELNRNKDIIYDQLLREEQQFSKTIEIGLEHLNELLDELDLSKGTMLDGKQSFELYATHGLPLEITRDIARERGIGVDEKGFRDAMEAHRLVSSAGKSFEGQGIENAEFYGQILYELKQAGKLDASGVHHDPYGPLSVENELLAIVYDGEAINTATADMQVEIIISNSPFYIESGGQVSDTGKLVSRENDWEITIENTYKPSADIIILAGKVKKGKPRVGDQLIASVDSARRLDIMRNHTATHLLHSALKKILGNHVRQAGSMVAPEYLRFDFTHPAPLTSEQIYQIEKFINDEIYTQYRLHTEIKALDEAIEEGATALFGEKYAEKVRAVSIGFEDRISFELCGGTHVENTGEIGVFLISNEGSIASGIRRIEAVTGGYAYRYLHGLIQVLKETAQELNVSVQNLPTKVKSLLSEADQLRKKNQYLNQRISSIEFGNVLETVHEVKGVPVLTAILGETEVETLRTLADQFRQRYPTGVVVLGSIKDQRPQLIAAITDDLVSSGLDAVKLIRLMSKDIGGGGGGKPSLAQAGGKFPENLENALRKVDSYVLENL